MQIFFIYGYKVHSWSEWGSSFNFVIVNIIEFAPSQELRQIIEKTVDSLMNDLEKGKLKKEIRSGGEGDLGGSSSEFYSEFFSKDEGVKGLVFELNHQINNRQEDIFIYPKEN